MMYRNLDISDKLSIRDSDLESITFRRNEGSFQAVLILKSNYPALVYIKILFHDIIDCDFGWNDKHYSYILTHYKLLRNGGGIYFSMDPYDESACPSDEDGSIIKCRELEGYYSSNIQFDNAQKISFK